MSCVCGQMPLMVKSFMEKARIKTNYLFVIYTYGMSETATRPNAISVLGNTGKKLDYVNAIKMVDNYLPGFEIQNQIETAGDKFKMAAIRNTMGKVIFKRTAAQSYIVGDDCIGCGICAKVCPAENITVEDRPHFADHCEACYACLHNCPKNALHLKNEKSAVRFRNEHVALKDIIKANE